MRGCQSAPARGQGCRCFHNRHSAPTLSSLPRKETFAHPSFPHPPAWRPRNTPPTRPSRQRPAKAGIQGGGAERGIPLTPNETGSQATTPATPRRDPATLPCMAVVPTTPPCWRPALTVPSATSMLPMTWGRARRSGLSPGQTQREIAHMSSFDLSGRVAIVTGAAQGVGRGIALQMARAGADVVAVSRLPEPVRGRGRAAAPRAHRARGGGDQRVGAPVHRSDGGRPGGGQRGGHGAAGNGRLRPR